MNALFSVSAVIRRSRGALLCLCLAGAGSLVASAVHASLAHTPHYPHIKLMAIASCAEANIAIEVDNVTAKLGALAGLIGVINLFMSLVGGKEIPDFSNLAGKSLDEVVNLIDDLVKTLEAARKAIPIP